MLIGFVPLVVFAVAASVSMLETFTKQRRDFLSSHAIVATGTLAQSNYLFDESIRAIVNLDLDEKSRQNAYRVLVFDETSVCINDTFRTENGKTLFIPEVTSALAGYDTQNIRSPGNIMYAGASIKNDEGRIVGAVLLISSVEDMYAPIVDIETRLLFFVIILCIVITCFVYFVSSLYISPLRSMMFAVIKMSQGHLNIRARIKGNDEFSEMGRALDIMAEKLEQAEKSRQEFVSNVSHELKTPLSSIKILAESVLLQENAPKETYIEFLRDITSEVDRMTQIVNDLLKLVKLDRREIPLELDKCSINDMLQGIIRRVYPLAENKNINLAFESLSKVTTTADEMKLSLALTNVVENAVKYTPPGGVVKVTADSDQNNAYITVTDTGIGISEDEQQKIFERFYRVDKTRDRETGGTGLGLAITHATVLLHNGSIRVVSRENEGSTFIITLPLSHGEVKRNEQT